MTNAPTAPAPDGLPRSSRSVQAALHEAGLDVEVRQLAGSTRTAKDAAREVGCDVGAIASSLVFRADGGPVLVMTSGRHRVDTDLLAQQLGVVEVVMATPEEVRAATGQAIGGVAPVGHPAPLTTYVDEALGEHDEVWAAGGTPHSLFPLSFADLVRITRGEVIRVAED